MKNILWVPMRTDALFLSKDTPFTEATADFSRLPFFNGTRDVNADVANVSENIISQPFQDQNLRLRKGLHLHWALPDALNRGRHKDDGTMEFPIVPNRWLVTRQLNGGIKSWVVESDYLFPEDKDPDLDDTMRKERRESITIPVEISGRESGEQPFRYMGRKVSADHYDPADNAVRYSPLTTVGYGEPSFAAFYPNCHSVFGFHDAEIKEDSGMVTYQIVGWYSDEQEDFIKKLTEGTVILTQKEFSDSLSQFSESEAEECWDKLLAKGVLDGSIDKQSPVERAAVVPPHKWKSGVPELLEEELPSLLAAIRVVADALERHVREQTGWSLQPVVSREDLEGLMPTNETDLWEKLVSGGWLKPLDDNDDMVLVVPVEDQPVESPRRSGKEPRAEFEKYGLALRLLRAPKKVLLFSKIEVEINGQNALLPQTKVEDISLVIGNTGTEALSVFMARQLADTINEVPGEVLEEQLEALYLLDKLDHRVLDIAAKFDEARHEKSFNAIAGGHLWNINVQSPDDRSADATQVANRPELPPELAVVLNDINQLQKAYDRNRFSMESLGTQLYADWYKYMLSTYPPEDTRTDYPDIDEVRYFIETQVMEVLRELDEKTGWLELAKPEKMTIQKGPASSNDPVDSVAGKLVQKLNQLYLDLKEQNEKLPPGSDFFVLQRTGGPRFYEPKEPVVLLAEKGTETGILRPTRRHGQDGRLACYITRLKDETAANVAVGGQSEETLKWIFIFTSLPGSTGFNQQSGQPWNPFRLDWEVELVPLMTGTNIEEIDYDADMVQKNFSLPINDPDLLPQLTEIPGVIDVPAPVVEEVAKDAEIVVGTIQDPNAVKTATYRGRNPNIYVGKSLLTAQAGRSLLERLETYLKEQLPGEALDELLSDPNALSKKMEDLGGSGNPVVTALQTYVQIKNNEYHLLSQALSGFNDALLQLRQSYQLPISDPIGFLDYQPFTEETARLANNSRHLAPMPLTDFNPIRTGVMVINQLRLIDTFGQKRDIELGKLDRVLGGTQRRRKLNKVIEVPLPLRLAQPARLDFRWLSALEGSQEMNAVPASSPVCGWLLTNQLDDSLVVYDREGHMLGSVEAEDDHDGLARWNTAPGTLHPVWPEDIENVFLKKMVARLRKGGAAYVARFIDGMNNVLKNIEPETFESQQALSLLIGRPVALVRASLNLELQGEPAADQGWHAFYQDRKENDLDRKRDAFTEVKFPLRLGKEAQFNDGLVGFWLEKPGLDKKADPENDFYLNLRTGGQGQAHKGIQLLHESRTPIRLSIDDDPVKVSMLIDPRARIHATTGILPVKDISIPNDQYLPAMQRMAVTFLTAPLLTPAANVRSLLPTVEGYDWSWIERKRAAQRNDTQAVIERAVFQTALSEGILAYLDRQDWIAAIDRGMYALLSVDNKLEGQFELLDSALFEVLNAISEPQFEEDGTTRYLFSISAFQEKLAGEGKIADRAWNILVRSDIEWCRFIPDEPDLFEVLPVSDRLYDQFPGLGMESLVGEILQSKMEKRQVRPDKSLTDPERLRNDWREVFRFPTIERETLLRAFAGRSLLHLQSKGIIEKGTGGAWQIRRHLEADGDIPGSFEEKLYAVCIHVATQDMLDDNNDHVYFQKKEFVQSFANTSNIADAAWEALLENNWCVPVAERPDTLAILPQEERHSQELPGLEGQEFMIEEILQRYRQILTEPTADAKFGEAQMTIREGYLNLEKMDERK